MDSPLPRRAEKTLRRLAGGYPVVVVAGPRQSGKTTLAKMVFPDKPYASLEDPDEREHARTDPRGFLDRFPDGAVLDEAQRAPDLFSYLQTRADQDGRMGLFVLTGSQQPGLMSSVSQSLAGRAGFLTLLPFSLAELRAAGRAPKRLEELLFEGLYPPVHVRRVEPGTWYGDYARTYVERDVRQLINVRDLATFQTFVRLCAARTGQLLNLSSLGDDCGITHNTAAAWISVLEACFLVHRLKPYHGNFRKRLVKTPKLYFLDTGLASRLIGIENARQLETHPLRGPLFETWAVAEMLKARFDQAREPGLYFWRDKLGREIDALAERDGRLVPVEVKAGKTVSADALSGIAYWRGLTKSPAAESLIVYGGEERKRWKGVSLVPWKEFDGSIG